MALPATALAAILVAGRATPLLDRAAALLLPPPLRATAPPL